MKVAKFITIVAFFLGLLVAAPAQQVAAAPPPLLNYIAGLAPDEDSIGDVVLGEVAKCVGRAPGSEWSLRGTLDAEGGLIIAGEKGLSPYFLEINVVIEDGKAEGVRVVRIDATLTDGSGAGFFSSQSVTMRGFKSKPLVVCATG